jgi:iron(III) transport system substrate-binding protein
MEVLGMRCKSNAIGLIALFAVLVMARSTMAQTETIEELYKKALKEEGVLNCYCSLAQINAEKIYPVFEKRFPGIKINHVDATSDKLAARAITEARGGKTLADVVEFGLEDISKIHAQGLILEKVPPEASAYPANMKGSFWIANNLIFFVGAWNTDKVKKEEEPKALDDFGDPRWKGRLIAEPRDYEILIGLTHKHKSLEKARAVLTRIAANNVEFHKGHSQLAEFLVAGQAAACFTCYSHHYPARKKKGAPVDYMLTEGAAGIIAVAVLKNAPHPNTAWLFNRWAASEEGQTVYSKGGRTPAHPKVEPSEPIRPKAIYAVGVEDLKEYTKYEKIWKEIFKLR